MDVGVRRNYLSPLQRRLSHMIITYLVTTMGMDIIGIRTIYFSPLQRKL